MTLRPLHHVVALGLFAVASLGYAQTGSPQGATSGSSANAGIATQGAGSTHGNTGSGMGSGAPGVSGASSTHHKKSKSSHSSHATTRHMNAASTGNANNANNAYDTALRQCVQGAAADRDRCIDQAIQQHGR